MAAYLARHNLRTIPADQVDGGNGSEGGPGPAALPVEPAYLVTPDFIKSCSETLLKGVEAFRQRQVYLAVARLSEDQALARSFAAEAGAPPGAIEVMTLCLVEISQKYQILSTWGPEAMLIAAASIWILKDLALHKRLAELAKIKAKAESKEPRAKTDAEQATAA